MGCPRRLPPGPWTGRCLSAVRANWNLSDPIISALGDTAVHRPGDVSVEPSTPRFWYGCGAWARAAVGAAIKSAAIASGFSKVFMALSFGLCWSQCGKHRILSVITRTPPVPTAPSLADRGWLPDLIALL